MSFTELTAELHFKMIPDKSGGFVLPKQYCHMLDLLWLSEDTTLLWRSIEHQDQFIVSAKNNMKFRIKKHSKLLSASTVERIRDNLVATPCAVMEALSAEYLEAKKGGDEHGLR